MKTDQSNFQIYPKLQVFIVGRSKSLKCKNPALSITVSLTPVPRKQWTLNYCRWLTGKGLEVKSLRDKYYSSDVQPEEAVVLKFASGSTFLGNLDVGFQGKNYKYSQDLALSDPTLFSLVSQEFAVVQTRGVDQVSRLQMTYWIIFSKSGHVIMCVCCVLSQHFLFCWRCVLFIFLFVLYMTESGLRWPQMSYKPFSRESINAFCFFLHLPPSQQVG